MNKLIIALLMISVSPVAVSNVYAKTEISDSQDAKIEKSVITLDEAIKKAVTASPVSRIETSLKEMSKGSRQQAGLIPNPELSLEAENVAGKGNYKGTDALETTIGVSQLIEVGGKRSSRIKIANEELTLAGYEAESRKLGLVYDVTTAYIEAVAAEELVILAEEQKKLAQGTFDTVAKRVDAAADPVFQKSKASVALSAAKIAVKQAQQQEKISKKKLVSFWNGRALEIELDNSFFRNLEAPQDYQTIISALKNSPDYQRWNALHAQSKAVLDLEKANSVPDPSINVGVRDFRETGDQAFLVGVSIPFPVFNRNQGNISKAGHGIAKVDAERQKAWIDLETSLESLTEELEGSFSEAQIISENTLPAAQKAFSEARRGHSAGKFAYLEVLDAQRTLSDVREEYINALKKYHITRAEINRLSGSNTTLTTTSEGNSNE